MKSTAATAHQHGSHRTVDRVILHLGLALVAWSRRGRRTHDTVDRQLLLLATENALAERASESMKHLYELEPTR